MMRPRSRLIRFRALTIIPDADAMQSAHEQ